MANSISHSSTDKLTGVGTQHSGGMFAGVLLDSGLLKRKAHVATAQVDIQDTTKPSEVADVPKRKRRLFCPPVPTASAAAAPFKAPGLLPKPQLAAQQHPAASPLPQQRMNTLMAAEAKAVTAGLQALGSCQPQSSALLPPPPLIPRKKKSKLLYRGSALEAHKLEQQVDSCAAPAFANLTGKLYGKDNKDKAGCNGQNVINNKTSEKHEAPALHISVSGVSTDAATCFATAPDKQPLPATAAAPTATDAGACASKKASTAGVQSGLALAEANAKAAAAENADAPGCTAATSSLSNTASALSSQEDDSDACSGHQDGHHTFLEPDDAVMPSELGMGTGQHKAARHDSSDEQTFGLNKSLSVRENPKTKRSAVVAEEISDPQPDRLCAASSSDGIHKPGKPVDHPGQAHSVSLEAQPRGDVPGRLITSAALSGMALPGSAAPGTALTAAVQPNPQASSQRQQEFNEGHIPRFKLDPSSLGIKGMIGKMPGMPAEDVNLVQAMRCPNSVRTVQSWLVPAKLPVPTIPSAQGSAASQDACVSIIASSLGFALTPAVRWPAAAAPPACNPSKAAVLLARQTTRQSILSLTASMQPHIRALKSKAAAAIQGPEEAKLEEHLQQETCTVSSVSAGAHHAESASAAVALQPYQGTPSTQPGSSLSSESMDAMAVEADCDVSDVAGESPLMEQSQGQEFEALSRDQKRLTAEMFGGWDTLGPAWNLPCSLFVD